MLDADNFCPHVANCNHCAWREPWSNERAAQAAAVWHVHDEHREVWLEVIGDRTPLDPRPVELGDLVNAQVQD